MVRLIVSFSDYRRSSQTLHYTQFVEWGETFQYLATQVNKAGWKILVQVGQLPACAFCSRYYLTARGFSGRIHQVWTRQSRFLGEAEIQLSDFASELSDSSAEASLLRSATLMAENQAGRQVTGKVSARLSLASALPPALLPTI